MPTAAAHPAFPGPSNPNVKIWRYMDFTKYVSLLDSGSLYFSRADQFEDPFEGANTSRNVKRRQELSEDIEATFGITGMLEPEIASLWEHRRRWIYINCWHVNEFESAALWRLYSQSAATVAVQTTFARLRSVLPPTTLVGLVRYIDYDTDELPEGNLYYAFTHKRRSFEHERELRAVIKDWPTIDNRLAYTVLPNPILGREVEVPLDELIEHVYVAPTAPEWFRDLAERLTRRYDRAFPVLSSSLSDRPVY